MQYMVLQPGGSVPHCSQPLFTCEEDNLVVAGTLIYSVYGIQGGWQASPEAMDLSRTQRDQVFLPGQSPEEPP